MLTQLAFDIQSSQKLQLRIEEVGEVALGAEPNAGLRPIVPHQIRGECGFALLVDEGELSWDDGAAGNVEADGVPAALRKIYGALIALPVATAPSINPAVPLGKSIANDYLTCLKDGSKMKILKRHLRTRRGLSPDQYRTERGLPEGYPLTAP